MALSDRPKVDTFANNSAESVKALTGLFYEPNGYISRPDIPDKGCDYFVEVVHDGDAKMWRFPLQLKSVQTPKYVDKGRFISYNFELSRLGYLLEHKPVVGMVVFYSIPDCKLYYDYVDNIYFRLKDAHDNDSWELQDSVNIRIPVKNQLTPDCIKEVHGYMRQTFTNFNTMYAEHAQAHGLPFIRKTVGLHSDGGIVAMAVKGLKDHGMDFLQSGDIMQLYQMVSVIPNGHLGADPILSIMAGMTYHEMGLYVDAEYYLAKGLYRQIRDAGLKESAEWTKLKNDYRLNRLNRKEFLDRLKQMRDLFAVSNPQNTVLLDLHIIKYAITGDSVHDPLPANIEFSINEITTRIDQLKDEPKEKMFLQLINAENFSLYLQRITDHHYLSIIQQSSQGKFVLIDASLKLAEKLNEKLSGFRFIVSDILKKAGELNIPLIEAEAFAILGITQLSLELSLLYVPDLHSVLSGVGHKAIINDHIRYLLEAYNRYLKHGYFDRAYHQICNALELVYIAEFHKFKVAFDKIRLEVFMAALQEKLQAPSYIFQSLKLIKGMDKENELSEIPK